MEIFRIVSGEIFKRKLANLIVLAVLASCGPKNAPNSVEDQTAVNPNIVLEAVQKTFMVSGFMGDFRIQRRGFEMYPDGLLDYSIRFQYPDKVHLKPKSTSQEAFSDEIIGIGSREYHFVSGKWQEYPRTDLSDLYFQTELVLLDSNFIYDTEKSSPGNYAFVFKPNLPLLDPLGKIITSGLIVVGASDTIVKSIKAYSPDSSFLWSLEITSMGIEEDIHPPSLFYYFLKIEPEDLSDTLSISQRLRNIGCSNVKISAFRKILEVELFSEREFDFIKKMLTSKGEWSVCEVKWVEEPSKYLMDNDLLQAEYGDGSRIDYIAGIPYKPVVISAPILNFSTDSIARADISYSAIDRISLEIEFSEFSSAAIEALPQASKIGLVLDNSLVAIAWVESHENGYSFIWERESEFDIDLILSILNSKPLAGKILFLN
ncbi:hypothetical protein JXA84_03005 [candidate division WOR-3 bacterium]|nr:hypothetical protein [candidate division WOR-3 bacterium]